MKPLRVLQQIAHSSRQSVQSRSLRHGCKESKNYVNRRRIDHAVRTNRRREQSGGPASRFFLCVPGTILWLAFLGQALDVVRLSSLALRLVQLKTLSVSCAVAPSRMPRYWKLVAATSPGGVSRFPSIGGTLVALGGGVPIEMMLIGVWGPRMATSNTIVFVRGDVSERNDHRIPANYV